MKQVWQADDGTIFETKLDCEGYEDKLRYKEDLELEVNKILSYPASSMFFIYLDYVTLNGHSNKLINYIKSIGEKNGN